MIRTALCALAVAALAAGALPGCDETPTDDAPEQTPGRTAAGEPTAAAEPDGQEPAPVARQFCAWRVVDVSDRGETVALVGEANRDAEGRLTTVTTRAPDGSSDEPASLERQFTLGPYADDRIDLERVLPVGGVDGDQKLVVPARIRTVPGHNLAWVEEEQPGQASADQDPTQRGYFVYSTTPAHTLVEGLSVLLGPTTEAVREASTFTYDAKGRVLEVVARDASAKTTIAYRDDGGFDAVVREQEATVSRASYVYDDHGRLAEVRTDADADGQPDRIVRFQYTC